MGMSVSVSLAPLERDLMGTACPKCLRVFDIWPWWQFSSGTIFVCPCGAQLELDVDIIADDEIDEVVSFVEVGK